jgi:hypothetical protein
VFELGAGCLSVYCFSKARSFDCTAWLSSVCVEYDGVVVSGVLKREDCVFVTAFMLFDVDLLLGVEEC